jgi:hypothetical protein
MWLRPLQGTTQQGLLVLPSLSSPPNIEPSNPPKRIFLLTARVTMSSPKRFPGSSKGEFSNAGLSSNSRGVLRPFDASTRASPLHPGLPHRVRSAHRVSHPLDGLLLARTPGLVSCRKRPWGFALQGFSLTTRSCQLVAARIPSWRFSIHRQQLIVTVCGVWPVQTSQPAAQTIRRLQGFAPVVNPFCGRTVTSEPSSRFPPELSCLSRVLPRLNGHVTRNVFTHALFPLNRPWSTEQARQAKV